MVRNLGELRDHVTDLESGAGFLSEAESLYREQTGQSDFYTGFQFDTYDAMGSAIGMYKTATPDVKYLRPDAVRDLTTLVHTTVHETYHQKGLNGEGGSGCGKDCCFADGFIEWKIYQDMGEDYRPVDAYAGIARAAGKIVSELGVIAYDYASQGVESTPLLTQALFNHRMQKAANDDAEAVWEEAQRDVEATYANAA